jgi:hypothetical protein
MRALLGQKDAVRLLRLEVNRAGSQKKWAKKNGVTQSLISMVLSGDRPLNNKIISALKLRRVVVYERLDRTAGRPSAPTRGEIKHDGFRIIARKTGAVRWNVASHVILAWIVTLPAAALFGSAFYELYKLLS